MTLVERKEITRAALALELLEGQLSTLADGTKPVPALNIQGAAYLIGLTAARLGQVLGNQEEVQV